MVNYNCPSCNRESLYGDNRAYSFLCPYDDCFLVIGYNLVRSLAATIRRESILKNDRFPFDDYPLPKKIADSVLNLAHVIETEKKKLLERADDKTLFSDVLPELKTGGLDFLLK